MIILLMMTLRQTQLQPVRVPGERVGVEVEVEVRVVAARNDNKLSKFSTKE